MIVILSNHCLRFFTLLRPLENSPRRRKRLCLSAGKTLKYLLGRSAEGERPGGPGPGVEGSAPGGGGRAGAEGGGQGAASSGSPGSSQRRLRNLPGSRRTQKRNVTRPLPALPERGAEPRSVLGRPRDGREGARPRPAPTALPSPVSSFPPGSAEFIHWDWFQVTPSLYF